jgi:hypothetical protein
MAVSPVLVADLQAPEALYSLTSPTNWGIFLKPFSGQLRKRKFTSARGLGHQFGSDAMNGDQSTEYQRLACNSLRGLSASWPAALACFCAACFRVDFGDLAPLCLITILGFADASLVLASITPVRGSQIGKTKLSVRKAEERP